MREGSFARSSAQVERYLGNPGFYGKTDSRLILEDTATDAEMMEEELWEAGIAFIPKRVTGEQEYLNELDNFSPDLILSDYNLPGTMGVGPARGKTRCPDVRLSS